VIDAQQGVLARHGQRAEKPQEPLQLRTVMAKGRLPDLGGKSGI
jgi:hypothetical protein